MILMCRNSTCKRPGYLPPYFYHRHVGESLGTRLLPEWNKYLCTTLIHVYYSNVKDNWVAILYVIHQFRIWYCSLLCTNPMQHVLGVHAECSNIHLLLHVGANTTIWYSYDYMLSGTTYCIRETNLFQYLTYK